MCIRDSIYTAPSDEALENDIKLSLAVGFNGARLHEKIFEERFLYHADRLGYIVWGEFPNWGLDSSYADSVYGILPEWTEEIRRDFNHPATVSYTHLDVYKRQVKLIALGNAVLEEHSPEGIGSYAAIINGYDEKLNETMKNFLEGIGYVGFANFDMKYDERDGKYKLFEMNLRQGRSSYFVTAAGYNIAKWLADDVIYNKPMDLTIATNKVLYTIIPTKIIFDYCPDTAVKAEAKKLIDEGKVVNSYYYKKDRSLMRWLMFRRNQHNYFEKYKRYFNNKGLRD